MAEETACARVDGMYEALYTPLSGTCGPISNPNRVSFNGGRGGVNTTIEMRSTQNVTTEIILKGCTVRMSQTVANKMGRVESQIDAETLDVQSATQLSGMITYAVYDDMRQLACTGTYDATFIKNTTTIGGAAE